MKRFRITETGYKFDKLIFIGMFTLFLGIILYTMYLNQFNFSVHPYFNCKQDLCENPFFQFTECKQQLNVLFVIPIYTTQDCKLSCDWCNKQFLPFGEYGEKPKGVFVLNNALWIGLAIITLGLLSNHFIHNKGKAFDIEIPITEKLIINRKKLKEWSEKANEKNKDNQ